MKVAMLLISTINDAGGAGDGDGAHPQVLQQRQIQAQGERDSLFGSFESSLHEAQQKGNLQVPSLPCMSHLISLAGCQQRANQLSCFVLSSRLGPAQARTATYLGGLSCRAASQVTLLEALDTGRLVS